MPFTISARVDSEVAALIEALAEEAVGEHGLRISVALYQRVLEELE